MWIRSQDRKAIINIDVFYIEKDGRKWMVGSERCINLGTYPTEERALEVLDEIQKEIDGLSTDATIYEAMMSTFDLMKCSFKKVYQMPEE